MPCQAREMRLRDALVLDENLKRLAHSFRMDQRFQQQAGANALDFACAFVVKIRKLVGAAERNQKTPSAKRIPCAQDLRDGPTDRAP